MKLQKTGGVASVANGIMSVIFLVILLVVFPRLGIGPDDWMDAVKCNQAFAASPITFFSLDIVYILMGIASLLTILALRERMEAGAPTLTQVALIATSIACGLWLAAALVSHVCRFPIASAGDASAFRAAQSVFLGLSTGGDHAYGWSFLLIGWAALSTAKLPRMLGYLIVLVGLIFVLDFLAMPLGIVGLGLLVILSLWLGIVLLRTES
jgi:hypothetical protein